MTSLIAWRNLAHDPVRFCATMIGIVFAVVLMAIQMGMLIGFAETTAGLVRNSRADVWVVPRGTTNVDQSAVIQQRVYFQALKMPGVSAVSRHIVRFVSWRRPQGGSQLIIVVGFDTQTGLAAPWNVVEGSVADLANPHAVMIDRLYAAKLGVAAIGESVEINGKKAVVVGFTQGARTFTQAPYVFTSYANALRYTDIVDGDASYVLVKAQPGVDVASLVRRLQATATSADVMTSEEFADKTRNYWIFTTGAGSALILGASLGALVGIVILAQTLYAATIERLSEYATLSAIGAGRGYLNAIVIKQALICGGFGYAIAAVIAVIVAAAARNSPAAILLSPAVLAALAVGALIMCCLSALIAIRKLMTVDPTSVFR